MTDSLAPDGSGRGDWVSRDIHRVGQGRAAMMGWEPFWHAWIDASVLLAILGAFYWWRVR